MKRSKAITFISILGVLGILYLVFTSPVIALSPAPVQQMVTPVGPSFPAEAEGDTEMDGRIHGLYFYADDCPHCFAVLNEVIIPLREDLGDQFDIRFLNIGIPEYYEAMLAVEKYYDIPPSERGIPTLVIADQILIGETDIRESLIDLVDRGVEAGGIPFPDIPDLDCAKLVSADPDADRELEEDCGPDEICEVDLPIYVAYFYQTGCKECSRVEADLNYLQSKYPQIQVSDFNIYDHADLAAWMTEQIDPDLTFQSPALFIGDDVLFGEEIILENIQLILAPYMLTGAEATWESFDPEEGQQSIVQRFKQMGWLAVVAAGLVDGINPCAFATLIFFVSYLTLSGRQGKEVLFVGVAFTLGVFLAYLAVGLGLYQVLELIGDTLDIVARVVYVLTGILCLALAVISFIDYRKAKQGDMGDMLLKLPESLRKRINATIRQGRKSRSFVLGAFGAGILISFLELACTGQVYLPTIIFVSSIPELRLQAFLYLLLYNALFVLPLVIIFVLVYYGTTSKDLTKFLQKNAAIVKFAMGLVFILLSGWLLFSWAV